LLFIVVQASLADFSGAWAYQCKEGICRVVKFEEISENDFNLNVSCYVEPVLEKEHMTLDQAIATLKEFLQSAYAAEGHLKTLLAR